MKKKILFIVAVVATFAIATVAYAQSRKYYCEYCGVSYSSISTLTSFNCQRHPNGHNKGKHKLYEGAEKSKYYCKFCGKSYSSISTLTSFNCQRHPNGYNKGRHAPAL